MTRMTVPQEPPLPWIVFNRCVICRLSDQEVIRDGDKPDDVVFGLIPERRHARGSSFATGSAQLHLALEHPYDLLICVTVRLDMDAGPDAPSYDHPLVGR